MKYTRLFFLVLLTMTAFAFNSIFARLAISNQEIVDILELPSIKIHCSVLAEEAIHRAIDDFKSLRNND